MQSPVHVRCIQATNWITIENVKITSLKWNKRDAWEPSKHWCQLNGFQGVCELDVNATYPSEPELLTVLPLWFKVLTPTKPSILSNNMGLNNVDSLYFLLIKGLSRNSNSPSGTLELIHRLWYQQKHSYSRRENWLQLWTSLKVKKMLNWEYFQDFFCCSVCFLSLLLA